MGKNVETHICKLRVLLLCYDTVLSHAVIPYIRGARLGVMFFPSSLLGFCFVWVYSLVRRFLTAYLVWVCVHQSRETSEVYSSAYKQASEHSCSCVSAFLGVQQ